MANIFNINGGDDDEHLSHKLNMDELYERKQNSDLEKLNSYKKVLHRIHNRIRTTCRISKETHFCWYVIPEVILGMPYYDHMSCIEYVVEKLDKNGFIVRYNHPNTLFISWNHWVPSYVRSEIKKKTGVEVDGFGNVVKKEKDEPAMFSTNSNKNITASKEKEKDHKDITSYKPTGRFIYDDIFKK